MSASWPNLRPDSGRCDGRRALEHVADYAADRITERLRGSLEEVTSASEFPGLVHGFPRPDHPLRVVGRVRSEVRGG